MASAIHPPSVWGTFTMLRKLHRDADDFEEKVSTMTLVQTAPVLSSLTEPVWLLVSATLFVVLTVVSVVDSRSLRIPDALSLPLLFLGLILAWMLPALMQRQTTFSDHLIGAMVAYLLFALLGEMVYRRTGREALGLGDAKLFAAAGAWLGWQALPTVLLIASVGGLVWALIRRGKVGIAFGPWIALGFVCVWLSRTMG